MKSDFGWSDGLLMLKANEFLSLGETFLASVDACADSCHSDHDIKEVNLTPTMKLPESNQPTPNAKDHEEPDQGMNPKDVPKGMGTKHRVINKYARNEYPRTATLHEIELIGLPVQMNRIIANYALPFPDMSISRNMDCFNCGVNQKIIPTDLLDEVLSKWPKNDLCHHQSICGQFFISCDKPNPCFSDMEHLVQLHLEKNCAIFADQLAKLHEELARLIKRKDLCILRTSGEVQNNWQFFEARMFGHTLFFKEDNFVIPVMDEYENVCKQVPLIETLRLNHYPEETIRSIQDALLAHKQYLLDK